MAGGTRTATGTRVAPTVQRPRRLLTVAHSYCVALNRRLANEMARQGGGRWEVTAVAPSFVHGDLRPIPLERVPDEPSHLEEVRVRFGRRIHLMLYESRLREILRRDWTLVHGWEEPYILAGAQLAWWTPRRTPYVFWTAQNLSKRYPPPFRWLEQYVVERAAGWQACGASVVEALLPRGYDRRPHAVLPLGVDLELFRPQATAGEQVRRQLGWITPEPPVVGYLGRFVEEKGVRLLMESLTALRSPWRALFVGGGPLEGEIRAWGQRFADRVRVVTGVPHARVPEYLSAMELLCAPSQTRPWWQEQQGRMLIEAFASGVPVLASDSGEIPHVVADAGVVAPEADRAAWSQALERLLGDPELRAELAQRGRERAHAEYAWPVIARRHLAFFDQILDQQGR